MLFHIRAAGMYMYIFLAVPPDNTRLPSYGFLFPEQLFHDVVLRIAGHRTRAVVRHDGEDLLEQEIRLFQVPLRHCHER